MKLTLLSAQEITSIVLPEKCVGHYWVRGRNQSNKMTDIIATEAVRNPGSGNEMEWQLKSNRRFRIIDGEGNTLQNVFIRPLELYRVENEDSSLKFVLYTEPLSNNRKQYSVYRIANENAKLTIGRNADNSIVYDNNFVSRCHAIIEFSQHGIEIRDLGSVNNTYVNGKAVKQSLLNNGDTIYIMGLKISVVGHYIFFNHPDNRVTIHSNELQECHVPEIVLSAESENEEDFTDLPDDYYYYRAPRFKHGSDTFDLKVDAPPTDQNKDEMPLIMLIGPSMTMGMASIATGIYSIVNAVSRGDITAAIPTMVMSFSMLLGTLMWPLVTRTYQRKLRRSREEKRQIAYQKYLSQMEQLIKEKTEEQEKVLRDNDVPTSTHIIRLLSDRPQIWERTKKHIDFLSLRLGHGNIPLKANIQYSERRFTIEDDNLLEAMYQFGEQNRWLHDVPVCLPLADRTACGVYASSDLLYSYAKDLILQLVIQHGYDEVKLVLICDENDSNEFQFARWLPHTMDQDRKVRYIATNIEEAKALSALLDPVIEYRKTLNDSQLEDESPFYVIVCLDKKLAVKTECVRRVLEHKNNIRFSVISFCERLQDLPKECSAVIELGNNQNGNLTLIDDVSNDPISFQMDLSQIYDMNRVIRVLANTEIDVSGSDFSLPSKYSFLEMFDVGMVEHLNLTDRWTANDPTTSLAAPIGIDKYGELFRLDLHERAHGPHGLIAGMTGSGKSEFIISYILSMAVNFHPNEVAFILIDYKGGGMAKSFEGIPHTAGVITNLDGNGIKRSLASMRSELHRRELIFQETSLRYNISNIDIYKYQKLFREGKVDMPLPHLLIVSDEFAELKKEQPDFMSELTSTARVGRSLGVHLILATQKPGGVVDDQIRSNSRFRISLKVQDNADSMEMLNRPDAATLVDTGRFYLQVGNNELFELGQSAWAGAPYYPSARTEKNHDDAITIINTTGHTIAEVNIDQHAMEKDPPKQLDAITEYISSICKAEGVSHWKMWLDPIPAKIYVDELAEKYARSVSNSNPFSLEPIIGEYDDPNHQEQHILCVPITQAGNAVVYGSTGSGKEMFLEAMCYSLIREHTPQEVNLYILDFGAERLTAFSEAPHVGDVILSYETEKVSNLFKLLLGKLETRKKMLAQYGKDFLQYNLQSNSPEPNMVVIINNYASFTELFEDKTAEINYLTREGIKYGIYFVLTCSGVNNLRFSLRQNFSSLFCLQLNNVDDYSSVVSKTDGLTPEKIKGRGLIRFSSDELFEFQVAHVTTEESSYQFIQDFSKKGKDIFPNQKAIGVPVLPEQVTKEFLFPYAIEGDLSRVPVGVEKETLAISHFDFTESAVNLLLSQNNEWQPFADALSLLIANQCKVETIVLAPSGKTMANLAEGHLHSFSEANGCIQAVSEIFELVLHRNNTYKDALAAGEALPEFAPVFVIIQSIALLRSLLVTYSAGESRERSSSDDTPLRRLELAIEKCEKPYNVRFVIAENVNSLTPFTIENWYKTQVNSNQGIWVGNGIGNQFRFTVNKKPSDASADLNSDFGFVIKNASASLVKLMQ